MKLELLRFHDNGKATLGILKIDGKFECFTLEDEHRDKKVMSETRIPEGEYEIKLRTEGTHHIEYGKKFPDIHAGMLWLQDVPNFQFILIHIGNTEKDSAGCILVGNQALKSATLVDSTTAYKELYKKVSVELKAKKKVTIKITEI